MSESNDMLQKLSGPEKSKFLEAFQKYKEQNPLPRGESHEKLSHRSLSPRYKRYPKTRKCKSSSPQHQQHPEDLPLEDMRSL